MKRILTFAILVSLSGTVQAAQLAMRFAGPNAVYDNEAAVGAGGSVLVEVTWTVTAGEAAASPLTAILFDFTAAWEDFDPGTQGEKVENSDLVISDFSTDIPGWHADGTPGTVGGEALFGVGGNEGITAGGTTVLGTFKLTVLDSQFFTRDLLFIRRTSYGTHPTNALPIMQTTPNEFYIFHPDGDGYVSQYNIGTGFAGHDEGGGVNPLFVLAPEPMTLGLMVLGATLIGRRIGEQ